TRCAECGAQLVCQLVEDLEVVGAAQATAAGYDDLGTGEFGTVALGHFAADERGLARIGNGFDGFDSSRATRGGHGVKTGGTHGKDLDGVARLHGGDRVASVDRTLEGVG